LCGKKCGFPLQFSVDTGAIFRPDLCAPPQMNALPFSKAVPQIKYDHTLSYIKVNISIGDNPTIEIE
jgi:hypothetical protein